MKRAILALALLTLTVAASARQFVSRPIDAKGTNMNWGFDTPTGSSGTYWVGGFYDGFEVAATTWASTASITKGAATEARAAHLSFVCGASTNNDTLRVVGISITDAGVLTDPDTVLVEMSAGDSTHQYYETPEKWLAQVTIERVSGATGARATNIGWTKYWDNNNTDFTCIGFEVLGLAGATDTGFNIKTRKHGPDGWGYRLAGMQAQDYPDALTKLATDHGASGRGLVSGENFAYKRDNLSVAIDVSNSEGVLFEVVTSANAAVQNSNFSWVYTE